MRLTVDEMMGKVESYVRSHVVPNLCGRSLFLLGFAGAGIRAKLRRTLEGLAEGDGLIDVDKLCGCVREGFDLAGSVLLDERLPIRFTQSDADAFFGDLQ